jgi:calcineurin-like phosphoesterase family protein
MAIYFTSDTHFGHANIIRHCNRPFATVESMDAALLDAINQRVGPEDTLYHLGDFCFRSGDPDRYRAAMRCKHVVLILGNHDPRTKDGRPKEKFAGLFKDVRDLMRIEVEHEGVERTIVMCHYALRVWEKSHHGAWHLFGHSHGSLPDDPAALSWDVGVDANAFTPLSVEDIAAIMVRKRFAPVDHHRDRRESP